MYHLVSDVDDGGGYACAGAEHIGKPSQLSSQFFCKLETSLKEMSLNK